MQMAEARPHLRNCAFCRASLRELTEAQAAIHVVLPAAVVLGATGLPDGPVGLFSRIYELTVGGVHDRLAVTTMKAQYAVEAAGATKLAAVAASVAALAGGGAIAVEQAEPTPAGKPAPARKVAARPVPTAAPASTVTPVARVAPRHRVRAKAPVAQVAAAATPEPTPPRRQEFGFETAPKAAPPAAAAAVPKSRNEDFGFER